MRRAFGVVIFVSVLFGLFGCSTKGADEEKNRERSLTEMVAKDAGSNADKRVVESEPIEKAPVSENATEKDVVSDGGAADKNIADEAGSRDTVNSELPTAIRCYQTSANAKDIDAYMACFTKDAVIIDVSRTIDGADAIRAWALREVIPNGETFKHLRFEERKDGYAKTRVKWLSWEVHYSYWWNKEGKITKMSLQYIN